MNHTDYVKAYLKMKVQTFPNISALLNEALVISNNDV